MSSKDNISNELLTALNGITKNDQTNKNAKLELLQETERICTEKLPMSTVKHFRVG